jgi:hypothetical protein
MFHSDKPDDRLGDFRPRIGRTDRARDRAAASGSLRVAALVRRGHGRRGARRTVTLAPTAGFGPRPNARRVVVKAHLQRLGGHGAQAAARHLRYIERDGVEKDGSPGVLYGREGPASRERFEQPRLGPRHFRKVPRTWRTTAAAGPGFCAAAAPYPRRASALATEAAAHMAAFADANRQTSLEAVEGGLQSRGKSNPDTHSNRGAAAGFVEQPADSVRTREAPPFVLRGPQKCNNASLRRVASLRGGLWSRGRAPLMRRNLVRSA